LALSIGIGLTSDCNLDCPHCYRPLDQVYALSLDDVKLVCEHLPVRSMGLGTGENALHPQFEQIVDYVADRGVKLSMASNGYSLNAIPEQSLARFHDVELSVDFPTEEHQDLFRGAGNWRDVHRALQRCQGLGLNVSLLAVMMNTNYDRMDGLAELAQRLNVNLRVNVYQPVHTGSFTLSYEQFWEGFRRLLGSASLLSCTEPVVSTVLGMGTPQVCGHESVRITPQRRVAPCVYWPRSPLTIHDLTRLGEEILKAPDFQQARAVPATAADCACQGGCASRRALLGDLDAHDLYCPWVRGDTITLDHQPAPARDLVRQRNYCTTIVS
jgi:MoaA/NifB/PqqE/SkfB family radical SAM enzyme